MAGGVAHVAGFGGGVVLEGSADSQRTDELRQCEGYDIGPRAALIAARGKTNYVALNDGGNTPAPWTKLYGLGAGWSGAAALRELAVGEGLWVAALRFLLAKFERAGAASPVTGSDILVFDAPSGGSMPAPAGTNNGVLVTCAALSDQLRIYQDVDAANRNVHVVLVNVGHRDLYYPEATGGPGLYALWLDPTNSFVGLRAINYYDALGTGPYGELRVGASTAGTLSKQLYFRGICAFNQHVFGWGYENGKYLGNAPSRVMFSNIRNPLKWGNDNVAAAGTDRAFSDTDAMQVGDAGERVRGGYVWNGRLWLGSDRQLHYIAGQGRHSFLVNNATHISKAENLVGPNAMTEGPDKLLYGVGDKGLWAFDGSSFESHHRRLRDFRRLSSGWWDLIWVDRTRSDVYPGKTNADLVWMVTDWDAEQVIVGIPWCNASSGAGYGTDTVLIKFHVRTGGFTKQIYTGVQFTAADYVRRQNQYDAARFLATATSGQTAIQKAALSTTVGGSAEYVAPITSQIVEFGPYALFGPNGIGVYRRAYLTLLWENINLANLASLAFNITPYVDDQALSTFKLTIAPFAPTSPADGDYWLDLSGGDSNLGNSTPGVLITNSNDWLVWSRVSGTWKMLPFGGQKGDRATIPIAWKPIRGTRLSLKIAGAFNDAGLFQWEGLGFDPAPIAAKL